MTINDINANLVNSISLKALPIKNVWEVQTGATFENGKPFSIFLTLEGDKWQLTDKKETLKYMNEVYDLKSNDVKNCIASVLKVYGFNVHSGELFCELKSENDIPKKIYDFIICIGQLANMYAFFDKP